MTLNPSPDWGGFLQLLLICLYVCKCMSVGLVHTLISSFYFFYFLIIANEGKKRIKKIKGQEGRAKENSKPPFQPKWIIRFKKELPISLCLI
jgi:hypothetical protein